MNYRCSIARLGPWSCLLVLGRGLHAIGSLIITVALLPLASAISLDLGVALFKLFGGGALPAAGAVVAALFLIGLWYVLPLMVRRRVLEPPP